MHDGKKELPEMHTQILEAASLTFPHPDCQLPPHAH